MYDLRVVVVFFSKLNNLCEVYSNGDKKVSTIYLFLTIACAIITTIQYEPIQTATLMARSEVGTVVATISIVHQTLIVICV